MRNQECILSPLNRKRLESQGYGNLTDKELIEFRFGMRFAYALCAFIVFLGLLFQSKTLLICAAAAAFLGIFPPFHPCIYHGLFSVATHTGKYHRFERTLIQNDNKNPSQRTDYEQGLN